MSKPPAYLLRWRGRQFGPLAVDEIRRQLDLRELCPWHEALVDGRWVTLEELLALRSVPRQSAASSDERLRFASAPEQPTWLPPTSAPPNRTRQIGGDARTALSSNVSMIPGASSETAREVAAAARPAPTQTVSLPAVKAPAKRVWFILLALGVGFIGLHNFYAGYWRRGAAQAAAAVITTALGYGWILSWAWALVEAVVVSRDRRGLPMT